MNPNNYFKSTKHNAGQYENYYHFNVLKKEFWEDYETYFDEKDRAKYIEDPTLYLIHLKDKLIESGKMENDRKNNKPNFSSFDSSRFPDFNDESFCNCHYHQHQRSMNDDGM